VETSTLFVQLALSAAAPDLVPASTALLMAEHALDRLLEASSSDDSMEAVLMCTTSVLKCEGVWQQLEPNKAMSFALRALLRAEHASGAPCQRAYLCVRAVQLGHARVSCVFAILLGRRWPRACSASWAVPAVGALAWEGHQCC
jgi:hypothetical protein